MELIEKTFGFYIFMINYNWQSQLNNASKVLILQTQLQ